VCYDAPSALLVDVDGHLPTLQGPAH
jgi:hypothetical protein